MLPGLKRHNEHGMDMFLLEPSLSLRLPCIWWRGLWCIPILKLWVETFSSSFLSFFVLTQAWSSSRPGLGPLSKAGCWAIRNWSCVASTASVALQIPQMILLSFNGAVNVDNFRIYEDIFNDKTAINPNNCSAKGTFFVSHKYSNYSAVQASLVFLF